MLTTTPRWLGRCLFLEEFLLLPLRCDGLYCSFSLPSLCAGLHETLALLTSQLRPDSNHKEEMVFLRDIFSERSLSYLMKVNNISFKESLWFVFCFPWNLFSTPEFELGDCSMRVEWMLLSMCRAWLASHPFSMALRVASMVFPTCLVAEGELSWETSQIFLWLFYLYTPSLYTV